MILKLPRKPLRQGATLTYPNLLCKLPRQKTVNRPVTDAVKSMTHNKDNHGKRHNSGIFILAATSSCPIRLKAYPIKVNLFLLL